MNFRLVLILSAAGILVGLATVFGAFPPGIETLVWAVLAVLGAVTIARGAATRHFLHGVSAGLLAGALAVVIEVALFSQYLAHNPRAAESFQQLPAELPARVFVGLAGLIISAVYGLVVGGLSALAARFFRRPASAA